MHAGNTILCFWWQICSGPERSMGHPQNRQVDIIKGKICKKDKVYKIEYLKNKNAYIYPVFLPF